MLIKRLFDLLVVVFLAPFWAPTLAAVALVVRWRLGSPIFFRQKRLGYQERTFEVIKFRSMRELRDSGGQLLTDEQRLTAFGKWLRSTSLDELPELWNILRGEMSLVGPRPLLAKYQPLYSPEQRRRHRVPPGLTGLAQVKGRNALSWEEKFRWDIRYVEERGFWLDLRILAATVMHVVLRRGVSAQGEATMPEFQGTSPHLPKEP